jgi:large subunit ribosomal protein L29
MELDKIRNLGAHELKHEEQQAAEQLFRLRFQMKLGQTEGVKKLRGLRKDIARIKTVAREQELGLRAAPHGGTASVEKPGQASSKKTSAKTVKTRVAAAPKTNQTSKSKKKSSKTAKQEAR